MPATIDIIGHTFSRLTVIKDGPRTPSGRRTVRCVCACGSETVTDPRDLRSGHATSCGCYQREAVGKFSAARVRHGATASPEHNTWVKIRQRCYNLSDKKFADYGGRGITVCPAWRDSFESFLADMGLKPSSSHSIERLDVNGNYEPGNCKWATPLEQSRNKRNHRFVKHIGVKMPLSQACEIAGVNYRSALYRLNRGQDWMPLPSPPKSEGEG